MATILQVDEGLEPGFSVLFDDFLQFCDDSVELCFVDVPVDDDDFHAQ